MTNSTPRNLWMAEYQKYLSKSQKTLKKRLQHLNKKLKRVLNGLDLIGEALNLGLIPMRNKIDLVTKPI